MEGLEGKAKLEVDRKAKVLVKKKGVTPTPKGRVRGFARVGQVKEGQGRGGREKVQRCPKKRPLLRHPLPKGTDWWQTKVRWRSLWLEPGPTQ